ncbi:MAG: hypothetical protein VCC00_07900 [Deltaproteobacteria bacterium]
MERILRLYREKYAKFSVRHFHEIARREHGVELSYTFVKTALQQTGLANRYIHEVYLPRHNTNFRREATGSETGFVTCDNVDLNQILCTEESRKVTRDNLATWKRRSLQIEKQPGRRSCAGAKVLVREHTDGTVTVWLGPLRVGHYSAGGEPLSSKRKPKTQRNPRRNTAKTAKAA